VQVSLPPSQCIEACYAVVGDSDRERAKLIRVKRERCAVIEAGKDAGDPANLAAIARFRELEQSIEGMGSSALGCHSASVPFLELVCLTHLLLPYDFAAAGM
jgi:hypothetical protein